MPCCNPTNRLRTKQKAINRDDFDEQIRSIGTKKA